MLKQIAAAIVVAAVAVCTGPTEARQGKTQPTIVATPNPVPPGPGHGKATITWSTGDRSEGVIQVSIDGGIERLFSRGPTGSVAADWIATNSIYEFRLYTATVPGKLLASVKVTRAVPPPLPKIEITPNPVPPGDGLGVTALTWTTGDRSDGAVFVSAGDETERLVTRGPSGKLKVDWVDRTQSYDFRLYTATDPRRLLAHVKLEPSMKSSAPEPSAAARAATVQAVVAAHPNPVPSGFGSGTTLVSWDVGQLDTGVVMLSVNGGIPVEFAKGPRGAQHASGVVSGSVYEYRLYAGAKPELVASIIVTRRDLYPTLFWVTLVALLAVVGAYLRRIRRPS